MEAPAPGVLAGKAVIVAFGLEDSPLAGPTTPR
jgi:hypothetical protein